MSPELFCVLNDVEWKSKLDSDGFVVIKDVLTENEMKEIYEQFIEDIKSVSPKLDFKDCGSFVIENTPMIFTKGMCVFNGFGQCDGMWKVRLNESIMDIYKRLFDTKELCVSMDGFSLFVSSDQKTGKWLHTDQNPMDETYSIQGAYNMLSVNEDSAGFVVVPGSHKIYKPITHNGFSMYNDDKQGFEELEEKAVKLLIPKNCFVLWNSKTLHANTGISKKPRSKTIKRLDRLTCYVTYMPRSLVPKHVIEKRICAYKNSNTTSHWANKCEIKKFPPRIATRYMNRGFNSITARLTEHGEIPKDRLNII